MNINKERCLEETNNLIEAMIQVVLPDFMHITALMKGVNTTIGDCSPSIKESHAQIIKELQYYDTLTQKMQHIIKVHDLILESHPRDKGKSTAHGVNLIRLNHLQFQVACFEYLSSVNHIEMHLKVCSTCDAFAHNIGSSVFQYSRIFLSASRRINDRFIQLDKFYNGLSEASLSTRIEEISAIYSMESERSVLYVYINKPKINDEELNGLPDIKDIESQIDLFE